MQPSDDSRTSSTNTHPDLIASWHGWRDVRAERRAVHWLAAQALLDDSQEHSFALDHRDHNCPDWAVPATTRGRCQDVFLTGRPQLFAD